MFKQGFFPHNKLLGAMNTLSTNAQDYKKGLVTENGFAVLHEAETYDQVSAVSACNSSLMVLKNHLLEGGTLNLFVPNEDAIVTSSIDTFEQWANSFFPSSIAYSVTVAPNKSFKRTKNSWLLLLRRLF